MFLQKEYCISQTPFSLSTLSLTQDLGTYEDASMAEDYLQWGRSRLLEHSTWGSRIDAWVLNWSLPSMVLTVAFGDEDDNSRYECSVRLRVRGAVCTTCRMQTVMTEEHECRTSSLDVH